MVELDADNLYELDRKSSKGNQMKFYRDGFWYKVDSLGYEGLAEYTVSRLLHYSTLDCDEFADYDLEEIRYNGSVFRGCRSADISGGWQMITMERFFRAEYGFGANNVLYSPRDPEDRLAAFVDCVVRKTGITEFGIYMNKMMTIDALFLNEDRHPNNIALLTDGSSNYRLCPFFDHGAALLSDTTLEYPLGREVFELEKRVKAKTFSGSFLEQLESSEKLFGKNIRFSYGYHEVEAILNSDVPYEEGVRRRVMDLIMDTRRKYDYLFC